MIQLVTNLDADRFFAVAYGVIVVFILAVLMIFVGGALSGVARLMLVLPLSGVVMLVGATLGWLMPNPRLRARHRNASLLRERQAGVDVRA